MKTMLNLLVAFCLLATTTQAASLRLDTHYGVTKPSTAGEYSSPGYAASFSGFKTVSATAWGPPVWRTLRPYAAVDIQWADGLPFLDGSGRVYALGVGADVLILNRPFTFSGGVALHHESYEATLVSGELVEVASDSVSAVFGVTSRHELFGPVEDMISLRLMVRDAAEYRGISPQGVTYRLSASGVHYVLLVGLSIRL